MYSLGSWFVSGICVWIPYIKEKMNNNNNNNNNNNKEAEKILKYKDLTIEIQHMWNIEARVIPVLIGATGTISKSFRKYVSNIPGNHDFN